jgi:hypothetical protein
MQQKTQIFFKSYRNPKVSPIKAAILQRSKQDFFKDPQEIFNRNLLEIYIRKMRSHVDILEKTLSHSL